jgi:uncharacterized membrane protein YdjX (TVP38/TMEM64 family)
MNRKKLVNLLLSGLALAAIWIYRQPLAASLQWFSDLDSVTESIRGCGFWGPAVLCFLFILQTFIAFIPGQALMVASGYVYGFSGGIMITWASLVAGGQMAFWLARRYGRPFAEKWITPSILDRWDKVAGKQGIPFYVATLVMPFFPNDAMCYVAGLGKMSNRRFLVANTLGRGIASLLTVLVGAFSEQIPSLFWIATAVFIVLGVVGWIAARHFTTR